jgi:hypothetical protein
MYPEGKVMFDPERIVEDVAHQTSAYFGQFLKTMFRDKAEALNAIEGDSWGDAIRQDSPLTEAVRLLVRVANNDIPGDLADEDLLGDVEAAIDSVCGKLFASPGNPHHYEIPVQFWNTELGQVIRHCQLWLRGDDLITYTEAAGILWPNDDVQAARMRIKRMVERGELTGYSDPQENNPQRAARVSRLEIEQRQGEL